MDCTKLQWQNAPYTHVDIIKELWPEEFEKAWRPTDAEQERNYFKLAEEYRNEGLPDWDEKASYKAYGDDIDEESARGPSNLYKRVEYNLKKAKERIKEREFERKQKQREKARKRRKKLYQKLKGRFPREGPPC